MSRTYRRKTETWMAKRYTKPFINRSTGELDIYDWKTRLFVRYDEIDDIEKRNLKFFHSEKFRAGIGKYHKKIYNDDVKSLSKKEIIRFMKNADYEVLLPLKKNSLDFWYWS